MPVADHVPGLPPVTVRLPFPINPLPVAVIVPVSVAVPVVSPEPVGLPVMFTTPAAETVPVKVNGLLDETEEPVTTPVSETVK